jgi:hypothetical protein
MRNSAPGHPAGWLQAVDYRQARSPVKKKTLIKNLKAGPQDRWTTRARKRWWQISKTPKGQPHGLPFGVVGVPHARLSPQGG